MKKVQLFFFLFKHLNLPGTRFLKRGVNDKGKVANDVETEQIVEESRYAVRVFRRSTFVTMRKWLFGSHNSPSNLSYSRTHIRDHSHFTSFVQIRGSIPLYWGQVIFS